MLRGLMVVAVSILGSGCATGSHSDLGNPDVGWPVLFRGEASDGQVMRASVPIPEGADMQLVAQLREGNALIDGSRVQGTPVAWYPGGTQPRGMLLRWLDTESPETFGQNWTIADDSARADAGWNFSYRWLEGNREEVPWYTRVKDGPLHETAYEMYQLDLKHPTGSIGLRMGLRTDKRFYWWQFVRADFVERGPVYDILHVGGPIYNEYNTLQGDLYLTLYANGVIEAYAHFQNHQREGVGTENWGVPVLAFDVPGAGAQDDVLDGTRSRLELGAYNLNLEQSVHYADAARPGSLRTDGDVVVWQPWLDQEIWGEMMVDDTGIPEHRIVRQGGVGRDLPNAKRGEADKYWVAKLGERYIPRGMARTVPFTLSLGDAPAAVTRYQAPSWWHAESGGLPTMGYLPASWRSMPRASEASDHYFTQHPRHPPFEYGCRSGDSDGALGAAMLMLGNTLEAPRYNEEALPPAYWWADIAIDHVDFTCHELPKYSWQWIVQPYQRWVELVYAYRENGDPYLLNTAIHTADAYYRFFKTNRPHRFVGRDALGCSGLLALYETTGHVVYLDRMRDILLEARRSYGQTDDYWPGHQSGSGPNGVARQPDFAYIPMLLARLNVQLLETETNRLTDTERDNIYAFLEFIVQDCADRESSGGWEFRRTGLSYMVLSHLIDAQPDRAEHWLHILEQFNKETDMPERHDGAKAYSWMTGAIRFDAWAWGATWQDGALRFNPQHALLSDSDVPKKATIYTPEGPVSVTYEDGGVRELDSVVGG
jgi:hypothetical protein